MRAFLLSTIAAVLAFLFGEFLMHLVHPFDRMQSWITLNERGFVENKPGIRSVHELGGDPVWYRFDSLGFRVPDVDDSKDPKPAHATGGTVLLGDSYAFGLHLPYEQTLSHRLGWRNGAVGGAGAADYLAQMEAHLGTWRPDTVVVLLSFDDALRSLSKDLYRLDPDGRTLVPSQRWKKSGFRMFMESLPGYHALQAHSYWLNGFIRFAWPRLYFEELTSPPGFGDTRYVTGLHHAMFRQMDALCRSNGCEFFLAHNGYTAVQTQDPHQLEMIASLPSLDSLLSHPVVDCAPRLLQAQQDGVPLELPNDTHPSAEGIGVVADCLEASIRKTD